MADKIRGQFGVGDNKDVTFQEVRIGLDTIQKSGFGGGVVVFFGCQCLSKEPGYYGCLILQ